MIKISVIISVYNNGRYLRDALICLKNQSLREIEIICVDDDLTDESEATIKEFVESDSRFIHVSTNNEGITSARNKAVLSARGDYIYFLDMDDYIQEDTLEKAYDDTVSRNLDMVLFNKMYSLSDDILDSDFIDYYSLFRKQGDYSGIYAGMDLMKDLITNEEYIFGSGTFLVRNSFLKENNLAFESQIMFEDHLFLFEVMHHAKRAGYISDALIEHHAHLNSVEINKPTNYKITSLMHIIERIRELYESSECTEAQSEALLKLIGNIHRFCIDLYNTMPEAEKELCLKNIDVSRIDFNTSIIIPAEYIDKYNNIEKKYRLLYADSSKAYVERDRYKKENRNLSEKLNNEENKNLSLNERLNQTYAEKSEINAKLQQTYAEKSEINAKLQQTYAEKSEINAKLQQTYAEKSERGIIIRDLKAERKALKTDLKKQKKAQNLLKKENDSLKRELKSLNKKYNEVKTSRSYKWGRVMTWPFRKIKSFLKRILK